MSLCLFSFAGVPPLIGFFAKQQVLYSSNSAGYFFLSLTAIIVSVISAFYYLKIIKIVFSAVSSQVLKLDLLSKSNKTKADTQPLNSDYKKWQELNLNGEGILFKNSSLFYKTSLTRHYNEKFILKLNTFYGLSSFAKEHKYVDEVLTNIHSFIIGVLTLSLMIFIFNPELLLNSIAIITSLIFNF